ncbi:MAG: hypothetical protein F6J90_11120 [Moorea sp. SIOASIH]|nr:hypothetical protein [Moorena sp. SIOASIH]NEO36827.1 hypothetical protein [Moorena sp. SIOASIH]
MRGAGPGRGECGNFRPNFCLISKAMHRFASILVHCSLFPVPCSRLLPEV